MELRILRYFLVVAREESISGAANFLHVTQPTLSRQLMDLEEELKTKLFIRGNRKITLTDEGIFLRKRAEEIVDMVDKTESEFHTGKDIVNGSIYIGGGETEAMRIIANVIKDIQKDYPFIRYHLFSGNADSVTERLDKGLMDFGILIEPANIKKYDYFRLPAKDTWGVLMHKDSPLALHDTITPEDLWNVPIICSSQSLVESDISRWIKKNFEELNVVATYNLVYNASLMVEEGIGYALTLDHLINTTGSSSLCFRPLNPKMEVNLFIVWKKQQVFSNVAKIFISRIQEMF